MLGATFFRLRYIASWSASCGAVPFAAAPASAAVVSPLLPAGKMLNASPGEQSTKGEPTGGWMVTQAAAAAGIASCPPRALDASARIEARTMSLNTCRPPLRWPQPPNPRQRCLPERAPALDYSRPWRQLFALVSTPIASGTGLEA